MFSYKLDVKNTVTPKFCLICCSNHAMDMCLQHFTTSDRHVYDMCYKQDLAPCTALCRSEIDTSLGPNRQQLSCAATADRVIHKIEPNFKPNEKVKGDIDKNSENTVNLLHDAFAATKDGTTAELTRFLSKQTAKTELQQVKQ